MSADSIPEPERLSWSFDAVRFGTAIAQRRTALGLSTRDLARLAAISQSYVVALERSRLRGDGPTPTIDVVARLASALGLSPTDLFHGGLRRTSTHVLLVVDDLRRATMPSVLRAAPELQGQTVLLNLSGRGDKDVNEVARLTGQEMG